MLGAICWLPPASADEMRFASRRDWQAWPLPGTVELTPQGGLKPIAARRDINAALNAAAFGGGIRSAGSNLRDAPLVMDGDLATGWYPHLDDPPESWNIEVDLGRGVSARRVKLIFDPQRPAPALFDLLLSTGEHAVDEVDNPIAGTVIYRQRERFKENTRHEITYELDQSFHTPIQYVRLDLLALEPDTRLLEVEVEALGDNLALGTLERGGNLEVVLDAFVAQDLIPLGNARVLVDGDLSTRWFVRRTIQAERDVFSHIVLDLGATYFVDKLKIVGGVVARPGGGITGGSGRFVDFFVTLRSFGFNFYEVLGSDGSVAPDGTLIWQKYYSGTANEYVKKVTGVATHAFGLVPTRFIRVLWKSWDASNRWAFRGFAEELQVFGEGFPQNLEFRSHIIDF
ncbi:MAG: discoidin domain-containing protein, partial [Gemmatimonadetes bacterium]|nr:discoidin domain-containing protein [Gemmatimonadota bacterium]